MRRAKEIYKKANHLKKIVPLIALLTSPLCAPFVFTLSAAPSPLLQNAALSNRRGSTGDAGKSTQDLKIIEMLDYHLRALREHDIPAAYGTTSKEFRNTTPLEGFKKFTESFPILTNHKQVDIKIEAIQSNRADVMIVLNPDNESIPVDYQLVKEAGLWKIWNVQVISRTAPAIAKLLANPESIKQPIEEQLKTLRDKQVVKAYDLYTSNPFKAIVSLDIFKQFLMDFPSLVEYDSIKFSTPSIHNGTGLVSAELHDDKGTTIFEYTMGIEDEKWKIWGIEVTSQPTPEAEPEPTKQPTADENQKNASLNPAAKPSEPSKQQEPSIKEKEDTSSTAKQAAEIEKNLIQIITDQIKLMREGDLTKAYQEYTSKEFQATTSFEQFSEFVRNHAALVDNKSSEFGQVVFENNIGIVIATLIANDGTINTVEYSEVNQNGTWKLLQMKVFPAKVRDAGIKSGLVDVKNVPFSFNKIVFGSSMNAAGYITNPTTKISSDANKFYINLYLSGGTTGNVIKVQISNTDINSSLPPISTTLQQDGDAVVTFVFSPPLEGWPAGNYQAHVTSSTGISSDYNFTIE